MDEFCTPVHVRRHIEKVTSVAHNLAKQLFQKGVFLDTELVKNAALCHDLVRYVDFPGFDDLSHYEEEIGSEKLTLWQQVHQKYSKLHHGDAIADILRKRGYDITADVAASHMTPEIFRKKPFSWEEKIVYYADKRVLHDTIVPLDYRFEDGRKRYGHNPNSDLEARVFSLQEEIFSHLDITPDDIL
jgi:HD superfamily phosphodiesterase